MAEPRFAALVVLTASSLWLAIGCCTTTQVEGCFVMDPSVESCPAPADLETAAEVVGGPTSRPYIDLREEADPEVDRGLACCYQMKVTHCPSMSFY